MKKIVLFLIACISSIATYAVVATPEPIEVTQADGTTITVRLVGDEYHSYYTMLDGTPIRLNDKGMWVQDANVAVMPQKARHAREIAKQAMVSSTYPLTGSPKSLVILVNFKDLAFKYTLNDFQRMLTESGYSSNNAIGSCRDYFIASSDSIFSPQFDCYGPVTLSQGYTYYDSHTARMIVEACNLVADMGVDMTQYDTNGDDRLDNVFVYYAGHNEAEGAPSNTIWPHRSIVQTGDRVQGKLIYDYACTSELRGSAGNSMCGIGTFCHEFGHVLGLPDYYATDQSGTYTIGSWDIMSSGSYNGSGKTPPTYTAGERFQLGWVTPTQLIDAGAYTLEPIENGKKQMFLIAESAHNLSWGEANPSEYWLLENRQRVGWDAAATCLPGTGLFIWHVDYNASIWGANHPNDGDPLRYDLEEAGGKRGYSASSDPFPGTSGVTQFTPVLHNGEMLEQPITGIIEDGQNITFTFKSNDFMFIPTELPVIKSTYNTETKTGSYPASIVKVVGVGLEPNEDVTISISGTGFQLSLDSASWKTTTTVKANADSTIDVPVYVRYFVRVQECDIKRGTLTAKQGSKSGSLVVQATCPRPILITTPDVTRLEEVTPTSFKVFWDPVTDAEEYYVTLYHMEEGRESTVESFEGFDEEVTVAETGWYTNFYRTTTKAKDDGAVSMWFKENNEYIMSPVYPLPVVELSMWLNAPATSDSEVGFFTLVGMGEAGDDTISVISVTKNTKKETYSVTLGEEKGYRRFILSYTSLGGEGVCVDVFTTTFNQKTVYTYKGREKTIPAQTGEEAAAYTVFYAYDLIPNTDYHVQLQCSENKGCEEHISSLSMPFYVNTQKGEAVDSKHLTFAYDSINYDPATHVIYLPQSLTGGSLNLYSTEGELILTIPVKVTQNVVPLESAKLHSGSVYLVKYLPENKMSRKSPWIKILFLL